MRPEGDEVVAVDRLGRDLTGPVDWFTAEEALEAHGLAWLALPWELDGDDGAVRVSIVELRPDRVVVRTDDFGAIDVEVESFVLPFPAPSTLRPAPPRTSGSPWSD